ncbi:MAG: hypothetical protein ACOYBD_01200 [Bilifractor sp.]|jgi:hypothetical protein
MMKKVKQTLAVTLSVSALCVPGLLRIPAASAAEITNTEISESNSAGAENSAANASAASEESTAPDITGQETAGSTQTAKMSGSDMTDPESDGPADPSASVTEGESGKGSSEERVSISETGDDTAMVMSSVDTAPAGSATPTPTPGPIQQAVPTPLIFADSEIYESGTEGDAPAAEAQAGTTVTAPAGGDTYYYPDGSAAGAYSEDAFPYTGDGSGAAAAVRTGSDTESGKTRAVKTGAVKTADVSRIFPEAAALGLSSACLAVLLRRRKHRKQLQN